MGKNLFRHDPSEHHPGCIKCLVYHFHTRSLNFARKRLPQRTSTNGKRIAVDEDDENSRPGNVSGEDGENSKMDNSSVEGKVSEPGSVHKKSMKARIKSLISEEVSKRTGRHKRSSSCPVQTQVTRKSSNHQNSPIQYHEPLDKYNAQVNEDITARSSPKVQEEVATNPNSCDLCDAMRTLNYIRQNEVNDKGKRPVKDHTLIQDKSVYAIERNRTTSLEESRLFLDALDLLNMRKELFLKVLRDPSSSLAQQLHEKRLSKSRGRLTKSMSFPCPGFQPKDVNCKHARHYSTHGDTKLLYEVNNSCVYTSAGESNDQSMPVNVCSDNATPEQHQRQPKPSGNVHHPNTRQDKVVIKRFKNIGEKIRHALKESRKDRPHIMKDAVLHKIPHGKKLKGYNGQGDTKEKPSKIYMKNNLEQKGFTRALSFNDSFEKYNRLLESDASREAKGKESERLKLKPTVKPTPITSIPKTLNRIYSSPDLGLYYGFQNEESLDSTWWETPVTNISVDCTSNEGNGISGKNKYLGSNSNAENQSQMVKISKYESQDNFVDAGEGLNVMSKCENIEDAGKDLGGISKFDGQEKRVDAGEFSDKGSKYESQENFDNADKDLARMSKCEGQENFVDSGEGLDKIPKCEIQENIIDAGGEGLKGTSKIESRENFVDVVDRISRCDGLENVEDLDEGLDKKSKCESGEKFVEAGFDDTDDLNGRNSAGKPILDIAYDSSYQEDDTDPAKYNLQDHILLDGETCLASQQHESSNDGTTVYEHQGGFSATPFHDTSISQVQVDKNSRLEFHYVKGVLDLSGFNRNEFLGNWHSPGQPVDPEVLDEVKELLLVLTGLSEIDDRICDHILLFDLVNEVLLDIYHKSCSYWPKPLYFRSFIHPMPMGYHVLEEVWADINCYLQWKPTSDQAYIDDGDAVAQDFAKYDGWMNLQFDSECVGLELEELLFDDLFDELLSDLDIK